MTDEERRIFIVKHVRFMAMWIQFIRGYATHNPLTPEALEQNAITRNGEAFAHQEKLLADFMRLNEIPEIRFAGLLEVLECLESFINSGEFKQRRLDFAISEAEKACAYTVKLKNEFEDANYIPGQRTNGHMAIYVHGFVLGLASVLAAASNIENENTKNQTRKIFASVYNEVIKGPRI